MRPIATSQNGRSFGTFTGVFVPTTLTILGAIMYLRLGWVVGNAGLAGAILICAWSSPMKKPRRQHKTFSQS